VRLGLPITDALSGNVFLGGEHKSFTADPDNSAIINDGDTTNKIFTGYNLNYSTLDDAKHPTTGLYAIFSQQYDGLDFNYVKTEGKARYFMPVGETGIVASVKAQAGIINNLGDGAVDATESFKEGQQLVRGFESGGYGPRTQAGGTYGGEYLGETQYAGLSAELQFPIPFLPESYGLDGAVWADAAYVDGVPSYKDSGSINVDPKSVDNKFKSSAGASVIWDSPFGPLRGDFGYVLSKATSDREQVFQITLQTLL
jgi:outer membrane protein insertion porin family